MTGVYKLPYFQVFWEEYQDVKRGMEYYGVGEEYNGGKGEAT